MKQATPEQKRKLKKIALILWGIVVFLIAIIVLANFTNDKPTVAASQNINATTETQAAIPPPMHHQPTLISSISQLKSRFNAFTNKYENECNIRDINYEKAQEDSVWLCKYMFNDNVGLLVSINKSDESIKEITMVGQGEGTIQSAANILMVMGGIMNAADPTLSAEDRGNILRKLHVLGNEHMPAELSYNTIKNGVKYWVTKSEELPLMFGASPADLN